MEGKTEEKKVGGFSRLSKSSRFLSELYTGRVEGFLGVKVLTERVAPELEVMICITEDVMISLRFTVHLLFVFILATPRAASALESEHNPVLYKTVFGLFLHDRGPTSDRHESGVDPNWELQFNPPDWKVWHWIGLPYPMVGITPNFKGDTSVLYAGITYEFGLSNKLTDALTHNFTKSLFVAGGLSAALHNGPLHKNPVGCEERSDCGFGYRVLPRLNIELATNFRDNHAMSLIYDHMSHKGFLPGENEGIDHIGIRYHYKFNKARP